MRYLITGGAGFIGSNIAAALVRRGEKITILDNFSTGRYDNIGSIRDRITLIDGDITDYKIVCEAVRNVDFVLHHAAVASVEQSIEDSVGSTQVNLGGTVHLLEASRLAGVKRLILASSAAVYGDIPSLPKTEDSELQPLSPYAAAKIASEYYCRIYFKLYGLETVVLRYFNVFGPNQDPTSEYAAVITRFINALLSGETPVVFGDGLQSRDFVFVDNVVAANLIAVESKAAAGETFNVASGERQTVLDLLGILGEIAGIEIEPRFEKMKPGDIRHSVAGISKAVKLLGYEVSTGFREGLKYTMDHFRARIPEQNWAE